MFASESAACETRTASGIRWPRKVRWTSCCSASCSCCCYFCSSFADSLAHELAICLGQSQTRAAQQGSQLAALQTNTPWPAVRRDAPRSAHAHYYPRPHSRFARRPTESPCQIRPTRKRAQQLIDQAPRSARRAGQLRAQTGLPPGWPRSSTCCKRKMWPVCRLTKGCPAGRPSPSTAQPGASRSTRRRPFYLKA